MISKMIRSNTPNVPTPIQPMRVRPGTMAGGVKGPAAAEVEAMLRMLVVRPGGGTRKRCGSRKPEEDDGEMSRAPCVKPIVVEMVAAHSAALCM